MVKDQWLQNNRGSAGSGTLKRVSKQEVKEMEYKEMTLMEVAKLNGVADLQPLRCRASFAQALMLESEGKHDKANTKLIEAVSVENN